MPYRNVWLSFSEWQLISEELKKEKYHSFQIPPYQLKEWKTYSHRDYKFERITIRPAVEKLKSNIAKNILYREYWRPQDMPGIMMYSCDFIGFILNHVNDVDLNTSLTEWEEIQQKMKSHIDSSSKQVWFANDLVELYSQIS